MAAPFLARIEAVLNEKKKKKPNRALCEAITAKGTQCTKYAIENNMCSVHCKASSSSKSSSSTKKIEKKRKAEPPKHNHGFMSPPKNGKCDLCDAHGMPFEHPSFEVLKSENSNELE